MSQYPPPPPSQYGAPEPKQTNGLAIASLIFGIPSLCVPLLGIVSICLGVAGMNKAKNPRVGGHGLAVAGMVMGIVGICTSLFIGLLISILLPSLNKARETANRVKCQSNM